MSEELIVGVPLSQLSVAQLALYNTTLLMEMKDQMSELSNAVGDLQNAVQGVTNRLLPEIDRLEQALSASQADDAAAAQAAEDARQATANIRAEVDKLNQLGNEGTAQPQDTVGQVTESVVPGVTPS